MSELWVGPTERPELVRLGAPVAAGTEGVLYRGSLDVGAGAIDVAVKMLQPGHLGRLGEWTNRWLRQVELLARVELPGLVRVRTGFVGALPHAPGAAEHSSPSLYLVMDWIDGTPLDRWARSAPVGEPEHLLLTLIPVAAALDLLHGGLATAGVPLVHRDVKPSNILMTPAGDTVLVDVGTLGDAAPATSRTAVGTRGYMAPEVVERGVHLTASDRYSLGMVAYFLLTGAEPPEAPTTQDLQDALIDAPLLAGRPDVVTHVLAMLDDDPSARPASLTNWVAQLRRSSLTNLPTAMAPVARTRNPTRQEPGPPRVPLLELRNVVKVYGSGAGEVRALTDVSFTVDRAEFLAVRGPSGSGKSTLLNLAGGLEQPSSGGVLIDGAPLSTMSRDQRAALRCREVGYVFQRLNLLPGQSALENVMLPLSLAGVRNRRARQLATEALAASQQHVGPGHRTCSRASVRRRVRDSNKRSRQGAGHRFPLRHVGNCLLILPIVLGVAWIEGAPDRGCWRSSEAPVEQSGRSNDPRPRWWCCWPQA